MTARTIIETKVTGGPSKLYRAPADPTQEHVVAAAIRLWSDKSVYLGTDHGDAIELAGGNDRGLGGVDHGFWTNLGRFITRDEARALAHRQRQRVRALFNDPKRLDAVDLINHDQLRAHDADLASFAHVIETEVVGHPSPHYKSRPGEHIVAAALLDPTEDKVYLGDFHLACRHAWLRAHPNSPLDNVAVLAISSEDTTDFDLDRFPELRGAPQFQEGYWTSTARFVGRHEAVAIARAQRQTNRSARVRTMRDIGLDAFDVVPHRAFTSYQTSRAAGSGD